MKTDYGVDAPGVIRNLLLVAVAGSLIWITARLGWWSGNIGGAGVILPLSHIAPQIARVLKPGGEAIIDDIRHGREYAASFAANGCTSRSSRPRRR